MLKVLLNFKSSFLYLPLKEQLVKQLNQLKSELKTLNIGQSLGR